VLRLCRSHPLVEALGGLAPLLMGRHFSSRDTRAGIKKHPMAPLIAAKSFSQKEDASSSILCRPCALVHASAVPTSNARHNDRLPRLRSLPARGVGAPSDPEQRFPLIPW